MQLDDFLFLQSTEEVKTPWGAIMYRNLLEDVFNTKTGGDRAKNVININKACVNVLVDVQDDVVLDAPRDGHTYLYGGGGEWIRQNPRRVYSTQPDWINC